MRRMLYVFLMFALFALPLSAQLCEKCGEPYKWREEGDLYTWWVTSPCVEVAQGETGGTGCEQGLRPYTSEAEAFAAIYYGTYDRCNIASPNSCSSYHPPCEPNCGMDNDDNCGQQCSPLELNLGNGPWRHSGPEDPVNFDLDMDGIREKTSWPARGSEIAFLTLDHDLDGIIASGAELFGNRPGVFANGFELLKVYDGNRDGLIDHNDPVWSFLRLWTDVSHDGISQDGEIQTLDEAGVTGLSLDYHETAREDRGGNQFRQQALYWRNGQVKPYYDVWLSRFE